MPRAAGAQGTTPAPKGTIARPRAAVLPAVLYVPHRDGRGRFLLVRQPGDPSFPRGVSDLGLITLTSFDEVGDHLPRAVAQTENGLWGHLDTDGQWLIEPTYDFLRQITEDGLARFSKDDIWGFVDAAGRVVVPPEYSLVLPFAAGLAPVRNGKGKWSYIDTGGKVAIRGPFESAGRFSEEGLAAVSRRGEKLGFIDRAGKWVIPERFHDARQFNGSGLAPAALDYDRWGLVDREGRWRVEPELEYVSSFGDSGYAAFGHANSWDNGRGFFDSEGKIAFEGDRYLSSRMACGRVIDDISFAKILDPHGKQVGNHSFTWIADFDGSCAAPALLGDQFGVATSDGAFHPFPTPEHEPLVRGDGSVVGFTGGLGLLAALGPGPRIDYFDGNGQLRFTLHPVVEGGEKGSARLVEWAEQARASEATTAGASRPVGGDLPPLAPLGPFFRWSERKLFDHEKARTGELAALVRELLAEPTRDFAPSSLVYEGERSPYDFDADDLDPEEIHRGAIAILASRYVAAETWGAYSFLSDWVGQRFDGLFERFVHELEEALGPGREPADVEGWEERLEELLRLGDASDARLWTVDGRTVVLQSFTTSGDGDFENQIWLAVRQPRRR